MILSAIVCTVATFAIVYGFISLIARLHDQREQWKNQE